MKKLSNAVLCALFLAGCTSVPYTNRKQLMLVSPAQEDQMGAQAYEEILKTAKISQDAAATEMVKRVGARIAAVAERPDFKWQFTLIDDPKMINAFCLPGGRVAVYTGILPITKDESGLAVVMGHEIAHALARHGAERISDQIGPEIAMEVFLKSETAKALTAQAYGVLVGLPFGRRQESESDRIGLILMAKAGYDPNSAIGFWQRMKAAKGEGGSMPEFLSSHPSDDTRIRNIQKLMPEALSYYKK